MRQSRWAIPVVLVMFLGSSVAYFLITVRYVGRHVQSSLPAPQPNAFEGPELAGGYILMRGLRGPESFIEDPAGQMVVPAPGTDLTRVGVTRLAVLSGRFIVGAVADASGEVVEWFSIDTTGAGITRSATRADWEAAVREATGGGVPDLTPADSFEAPEPAQPGP